MKGNSHNNDVRNCTEAQNVHSSSSTAKGKTYTSTLSFFISLYSSPSTFLFRETCVSVVNGSVFAAAFFSFFFFLLGVDAEAALYRELWHACAGPLVTVPREGEKVFYFPQGHIEQVNEPKKKKEEQTSF